jgi:hypothetical protein
MSATAQKPDRVVVDRVPCGEWHAIYLCRATESRTWDWVALLVDVHSDDLKHCNCKVAFLFVHPDEYCPDGTRTAQEIWVWIPGKHRSEDRAWSALEDMMAARH